MISKSFATSLEWNSLAIVTSSIVNDASIVDDLLIEMILSNDVIIYNSSDDVVQDLYDVVDVYLKLWKKIEFVIMEMNNWMRISLKLDWENRIFNKAKMYSLDTRDRELVNHIFNKLHEEEKLS